MPRVGLHLGAGRLSRLLVAVVLLVTGSLPTMLVEGEALRGHTKVVIYFESLCKDAKWFFVNQLRPSYNIIRRCADVEYVPFGKASYTKSGNGKAYFKCQHGPEECRGNKIMACSLAGLEKDPEAHTKVMLCMMMDPYPPDAGPKCYNRYRYAWKPVADCAKTWVGDAWLMRMGNLTMALDPKLNFIPWITIDGVRSEKAFKNFQREVCRVCGGC